MFWERYYIEHKERPRPKGMQPVRACMLYSRPPNLGQTPFLTTLSVLPHPRPLPTLLALLQATSYKLQATSVPLSFSPYATTSRSLSRSSSSLVLCFFYYLLLYRWHSVYPRNGTEQVDNLRIIQKLVRSPSMLMQSRPLVFFC